VKLFSRNKLPTTRDASELVRDSALDDVAGVEFEMAPCWQCSRQAGRRIAVKKVEAQPDYARKAIELRAECHGEVAHITITGIDPLRFERGYDPSGRVPGGLTGLEYVAINNVPFFTPHPEHELDFSSAKMALLKIVKAGEKQMSKAQKAADAIRRGMT
jgi:hypothetical protein